MLQRYIIKMRNSTKAKFIFIETTYKCCIAKVIRFGQLYFKNGEGSFPFYYFSIKEIMYNFAIVILLNNGIKTNFYL